MITLITGTPGTGKSAYCVSQLLELDQTRPLFVHGIPELKLDHEQIFCRSSLCDICTTSKHPADAIYVEDWPDWAPDAALIVLDEVQRIWRPRAPSSAVPLAVAQLEYHRHRGLDFFMMTQGPHLMDSNVKRLVGSHIHLVSKWAGRTLYEWPECHSDTQLTGNAVQRSYKLNKRVFDLYKSSTVHTQQKHRKPVSLYIALFLLLLLPFAGYNVYKNISAKMNPQPTPQLSTPSTSQPFEIPKPNAPPSASVADLTNPQPDLAPRSPGRIESAPAYDHQYQLKQAPVLTSGVYDGKKCTLFARGGRRYPTTQEFCIAYVRGEIDYPYESLPKKGKEGRAYYSEPVSAVPAPPGQLTQGDMN